jgi:hypothetical protein
MNASTTHFSGRLSLARLRQEALRQVLNLRGFTVIETEQELWLARAVHAELRFDHVDPMVRAVGPLHARLLGLSARFSTGVLGGQGQQPAQLCDQQFRD